MCALLPQIGWHKHSILSDKTMFIHNRLMSEANITRCCAFLSAHGINFERFDHIAVFTVDECQDLLAHIPGAGTKNLFLRNKSGRDHFLVTVPQKKQVDLRALAETLGFGRLSFASADRLRQHLGVEPGSVTPLGLMNDSEKRVRFIVDRDLLSHDYWQMHPLSNHATLLLHRNDVESFVKITQHSWSVLELNNLTSGLNSQATRTIEEA